MIRPYFLLALVPLFFASPTAREWSVPGRGSKVQATPAQVAESLMEADRSFAARASRSDMVTAMSAMFADGVIMPAPAGVFAMGKNAVIVALRASPDAATSRVSWTPVRAGVSSDGEHGFTIGYMTQRKADSSRVALKYMAYWVRDRGIWRVVAYKRARADGPPPDTSRMAPVLPFLITRVPQDAAAMTALRRDLMAAEKAFSDEAQTIGLGNAFGKFGREDAVNMGGPASPTFLVGASSIAKLVGGADMNASPVTWNADTAFVASSGDLGITFGVIRRKNLPPGEPAQPGSSFFTIWMRADAKSPWRYVAE
jgi:ketosteroid isomerase-like protein